MHITRDQLLGICASALICILFTAYAFNTNTPPSQHQIVELPPHYPPPAKHYDPPINVTPVSVTQWGKDIYVNTHSWLAS